jgi:para-nitrobenzyl esterase
VLATYPPGSTNDEARRSMRDVFREVAFAWPTWAWARLQSRAGKSKVFVYVFNHRPPYPQTPPYQTWGAAHGSELAYVFGHHDKPAYAWTPADAALSDQIETYWTNFAKTGDPNGAGLPAWPPFSEADQQAMHFDGETKAGAVPNLDKLQMWEGYYAWRRGEAPAPQ